MSEQTTYDGLATRVSHRMRSIKSLNEWNTGITDSSVSTIANFGRRTH